MSTKTDAKSIGKKDAESEALAVAIRKIWRKAGPEKKAEIARDFKVGYIAGREKVSLADAEAIFDAGKGAEAINAAAIDRATSGFNYHIVQGKSKPQPPKGHGRISTELRAAAMTFLGEFKGETLGDQIKAAIALLNKMK